MDTKERLLLLSDDARLQHLVEAEAWQLGIRVRCEARVVGAQTNLCGDAVRLIVWDADTVELTPQLWAQLPTEVPLCVLCEAARTPLIPEEREDYIYWQRPLSVELLQEEMIRTIMGGQIVRPVERERELLLDWEADGRTLRVGEARCPLTEKEACIMALLMQHRGAMVSKEALRQAISSAEDGQEIPSNKVEVYMCHLRRKLEQPTGMRLFTTVRGKGYRLETGI